VNYISLSELSLL